MSTWLASTRSQVRPAPASAFANALWPAAAVSAWPCGATASGELARIPACTPAQCSGTDHNTGLPSDSSSANASVKGVLQPVDLTHPRGRHPQLAQRQQREKVDRVLGEHFHRRIPMLLHRPAVAAAPGDRGLQGGRPERVAAVQGGIAVAAASAAAARQLPVLHPDPAEQQPVPVRVRRTVCVRRLPARTARPMTLRARTGSPPCSAASVTSAAGVSGATPAGCCSVVID